MSMNALIVAGSVHRPHRGAYLQLQEACSGLKSDSLPTSISEMIVLNAELHSIG